MSVVVWLMRVIRVNEGGSRVNKSGSRVNERGSG